ncbi:hypothetical protein J4429_06265 [Candidatus Pacearchaeota archaeon]|nr:hypothetical protein [Candidatus Pacearchaeota archaeon]
MYDDILDGLGGASSIEVGGSEEPSVDIQPESKGFLFPNLSTDYHYVLSSSPGEAKIGPRGFYVYLNRNFAQKAFDLVLSRPQYNQLRDGAKSFLDKLGFKQYKNYTPLTHFPANARNKRGLIIDLSLNGASLSEIMLEPRDFNDIMNGKLDMEPRYRTIGLTDSKRSEALQALWVYWINQMRLYGVYSPSEQ